MTLKLSQETLGSLPTRIERPTFDRSRLTPGIVHIGVGNFHRSHQAVYLNDLLNAGGDPGWGILGAGVREADAAMREALSQQDWLYSVVEVEFERRQASVIGAVTGFVSVEPAGNAQLIDAMANPATKIVSLTVTEGGYFVDAATGAFDVTHPEIAADIANPGSPGTVFGAIVAALSQRRAEGGKPFTVMSCDNLPGNGDITRDAVIGLASAIDTDLGKWIADTLTFPNGMVDRITPATGPRERKIMEQAFGVTDAFPVFCEPFRQWVLEDRFVNGRPELESVGVTLTNDVHQFERMKIRILNGGHAILAYPSALLGVEFVHDALATPLLRAFLRKVLMNDVMPHVASVPGFTPDEYLELICDRFANPGVADTIARLCFDGSNRQPKFIVPSVEDNLNQGRIPQGLALSCALWCRYCAGTDDHGGTIAPNDPDWNDLQAAARRALDEPKIWLRQEKIYGTLASNEEFAEAFATALKALSDKGTEAVLKSYLDSAG